MERPIGYLQWAGFDKAGKYKLWRAAWTLLPVCWESWFHLNWFFLLLSFHYIFSIFYPILLVDCLEVDTRTASNNVPYSSYSFLAAWTRHKRLRHAILNREMPTALHTNTISGSTATSCVCKSIWTAYHICIHMYRRAIHRIHQGVRYEFRLSQCSN